MRNNTSRMMQIGRSPANSRTNVTREWASEKETATPVLMTGSAVRLTVDQFALSGPLDAT